MAGRKAKSPAPADAGAKLLEKYEMADDATTRATDPPAYAAAAPAEPAAETRPAAEPKAPAPKHPAWLARKAKEVGITAAEADELSSDELKDAIALTTTRREENRSDARVAFNAAGRPYDTVTGQLLPQNTPASTFDHLQPKPAAPAVEKPFALREYGIDTSKLTADSSTDEILTAALEPMAKRYEAMVKRVDALEAALAEAQGREQVRETNAHFDRLDQLFAQDRETFGEGSRYDLDQSSTEFAKRQAVIGRMNQLHQANPRGSLKGHYAQAVSDLGYKPAPAAEPTVNGQTADAYRNGQVLAPTPRVSPKAPKGVKSAQAAVETILRRRAESQADTDERSELP